MIIIGTMDTDFEIFKGKSFSDLCKDIVTNSEEKKTALDILITDLREMINTPEKAVMLIPLLKEYFDIGVRNDEQLIKLAAIVQRILAGQTNSESGAAILTDEEKKQLMETIDSVGKVVKEKIPDKPIPIISKE